MTFQGDHSRFRAMLGRMLRAYSRRVAASSVEDLGEMVQLRAELEDCIQQAVRGLRGLDVSWADIAAPLGVTKQAAQQRYGR